MALSFRQLRYLRGIMAGHKAAAAQNIKAASRVVRGVASELRGVDWGATAKQAGAVAKEALSPLRQRRTMAGALIGGAAGMNDAQSEQRHVVLVGKGKMRPQSLGERIWHGGGITRGVSGAIAGGIAGRYGVPVAKMTGSLLRNPSTSNQIAAGVVLGSGLIRGGIAYRKSRTRLFGVGSSRKAAFGNAAVHGGAAAALTGFALARRR